jgi:hypothetical protein
MQGNTALGLGVLKLLNGGEVAVDEAGVRERPQMFGWLKFGRVGW